MLLLYLIHSKSNNTSLNSFIAMEAFIVDKKFCITLMINILIILRLD